MDTQGIERTFLHDLYVKYYTEGGPTSKAVELWVKANKVENGAFWVEYDRLIGNGMILFNTDDKIVSLTPKGTLFIEKNGFAPADLIRKNREMRTKLLHTLAGYLIKVAPTMSVDDLIERSGLTGQYCLGNIELLVSMGYARWVVHESRLHINSKVCAKDESLSHTH